MATNDPYTPYPTVEPSGPPSNDFFRAQPGPASFGGEIAQGGEKLGSALFGAAIAKQDLTNEIHASEVNTWQADRTTDLFSTFAKLQGRAAQDALPQFKKDINDTYNQAQANAGNLSTQAQVAKSGRMLTDAYYRYATNHADQQFTTWQTKTSTDRAGTYANMAGLAACPTTKSPRSTRPRAMTRIPSRTRSQRIAAIIFGSLSKAERLREATAARRIRRGLRPCIPNTRSRWILRHDCRSRESSSPPYSTPTPSSSATSP
jgi:hypothetical protein